MSRSDRRNQDAATCKIESVTLGMDALSEGDQTAWLPHLTLRVRHYDDAFEQKLKTLYLDTRFDIERPPANAGVSNVTIKEKLAPNDAPSWFAHELKNVVREFNLRYMLLTLLYADLISGLKDVTHDNSMNTADMEVLKNHETIVSAIERFGTPLKQLTIEDCDWFEGAFQTSRRLAVVAKTNAKIDDATKTALARTFPEDIYDVAIKSPSIAGGAKISITKKERTLLNGDGSVDGYCWDVIPPILQGLTDIGIIESRRALDLLQEIPLAAVADDVLDEIKEGVTVPRVRSETQGTGRSM